MKNLLTLAVLSISFISQAQYNNPQGDALEGVGGIILIIFVAIAFIIWFLATGGDMGTHADTGRPVKSLNTSDGKRARQRRAYNRKTYGVDYDSYEVATEIAEGKAATDNQVHHLEAVIEEIHGHIETKSKDGEDPSFYKELLEENKVKLKKVKRKLNKNQ